MVWGLELGVQGLGFRVGFRASGCRSSGCKVGSTAEA